MDLFEKLKLEFFKDFDTFINWVIISMNELRSISLLRWVVLFVYLVFFYLQIKCLIYLIIYFYWFFYKYFFLLLDILISIFVSDRGFLFYKKQKKKIDYYFLDIFFLILPKKINKIFKKIRKIFSFSFFWALFFKVFFYFDSWLEYFFKFFLRKFHKYSYLCRHFYYRIIKWLFIIKFYIFNKLIKVCIKRLGLYHFFFIWRFIFLKFMYFFKIFILYLNYLVLVIPWRCIVKYRFFIFIFLFFALFTNYVDAEVDLLSESAIMVKSYLDESIGNITNNSYNIYYKELLVEPSSKGYILLLEDLNLICSELINSEIKLIIDDYLSNHLIIKKQNADYYDIHKILVAVAWLFVAGFMAYHNIVDSEILAEVGDQLVTAAEEVGDQLVTPAVEVVSNIPIEITAAAVEVVSNIPIDITAAAAVVGAAVVEQMVTPAVEVVSNIPIETTPVVEQMVTPAVEVISNRSIETTFGIITYSTLSDYIRYGNNNANYLTVLDDILEPCQLLGPYIYNPEVSFSYNVYELGVSMLTQTILEALQDVESDFALTSDMVSNVFVKFLEYLKTSNLPNVLKSDERFLIWLAYRLTKWAYNEAYPDVSLDTIEFLNL